MSANATAHTGNNSMKARAEVGQVKDCGLPAHIVIFSTTFNYEAEQKIKCMWMFLPHGRTHRK